MAEQDDDPVIFSIFNYCDRRCERCSFTGRCGLFKDLRKHEDERAGRGPLEHVRDKFQQVFRLLEQWCEREGIDLDEIQREATDEQAVAEAARRDDVIRADPLHDLAWAYMQAAYKVVEELSAARPAGAWSREVSEAVDTIAWHSTLISSKTYRALNGYAERDECPADDPSQTDWNGSAKVARLIVAESKDACFVVLRSNAVVSDSPLKALVALLDQIDAGLAERFPRSMEFMRPGFDEPWLANVVDE